MFHTARRARPGTLLFHTWPEAGLLWRAIVSRVPGLLALVLMPDHLHLLSRGRIEAALCRALRAHALARNHLRGESGPVVVPGDPPTEALGRVKQRRDLRYVALNPCRARLVGDPLAWPFSTHRDHVGLAVGPVVPRTADPAAHHAFVSGDPHVAVQGTELPWRRAWGPEGPPVEAVRAAVSALTRRTLEELEQRGPARALLIRATVDLCGRPDRELGAALGCSRATLGRARRTPAPPAVRLVERVVGDPRFAALEDGPLFPGRGRARPFGR